MPHRRKSKLKRAQRKTERAQKGINKINSDVSVELQNYLVRDLCSLVIEYCPTKLILPTLTQEVFRTWRLSTKVDLFPSNVNERSITIPECVAFFMALSGHIGIGSPNGSHLEFDCCTFSVRCIFFSLQTEMCLGCLHLYYDSEKHKCGQNQTIHMIHKNSIYTCDNKTCVQEFPYQRTVGVSVLIVPESWEIVDAFNYLFRWKFRDTLNVSMFGQL
jgi:hypothetical protein